MRDDNLGISLEATVLADPRLDPDESTFAELLSGLGSPALRFGGNRLDRSVFWTSEGETAPEEELTVIDPEDLERLQRLVEATGSRVTLSVPFGRFDPERAADMASHAQSILGESLVGLSIGNEPNGYALDHRPELRVREGEWTPERYTTELQQYVDAIEAAAPRIPIIGPNVYDAHWMDAFLDADIAEPTALAQHFYALSDCQSDAVPGFGPRPENLIDDAVLDNALFQLDIGKKRADSAGMPLWLEEAGPTSCPGTNATSRTQASVLWAADFALAAAEFGVERVNMHSMLDACEGGAPMSPVCDSAPYGERSERIVPRVNYHGLRATVPSIGGEFLSTRTRGKALRAYAVARDSRVIVTVINLEDGAHASARPMTIDVPAGYEPTYAGQVSAESNSAVDAAHVVPLLPLPDSADYSLRPSGSAEPHAVPTAGESNEVQPSRLELELDSSSVTVLIYEKSASGE